MNDKKGRFIMIDGIAGSGKSTIIESIANWIKSSDNRVFDIYDWNKTHDYPPLFEDVKDHDIYFTFEPTRTWVGSAIRHELSQTADPYGGEELAHAFALDRQIMYRRLILPALRAGKTIIQDRGVSTSIIYQPTMPGGIPVEDLIKLPGNVLAIENAPTDIILTKLDPETAIERIEMRKGDSKGVFAKLKNLTTWKDRFDATWFRKLFEDHGTTFHELDTSCSMEEMTQNAKQLVEQILSDN